MKDTLQKYNMKLAGLALVCAWDGETEAPNEREAADFTINYLKHFPGAMLGTVTLPSGRKDNLQKRRLNIAKNVNAVSQRAHDAGLVCSYHPNSPPASLVRTQEDYDVVLSSLDPKVTGWTPDVGHIIRGGMDVIATLNKWQHLVNHIHYKDFSGNGAEPWAQMGTGKLDFHKITEWLTARNYSGWIICEDEAHSPSKTPMASPSRTANGARPTCIRSSRNRGQIESLSLNALFLTGEGVFVDSTDHRICCTCSRRWCYFHPPESAHGAPIRHFVAQQRHRRVKRHP
jgi:sugar phosphate isomerase/epimerase